jgi:hypothetical protein
MSPYYFTYEPLFEKFKKGFLKIKKWYSSECSNRGIAPILWRGDFAETPASQLKFFSYTVSCILVTWQFDIYFPALS